MTKEKPNDSEEIKRTLARIKELEFWVERRRKNLPIPVK